MPPKKKESQEFKASIFKFQQRDNTANSPLDALTIAKDLVSRMDRDEKFKIQQLLKQMARED